MRKLVTILFALAFVGATPMAAAAQTSDTQRAALAAAHEMFTAVAAADLIREGAMRNNAGLAAFDTIRPEWKTLMAEAMDEAVARDLPGMEALLARSMARTMSTDELNAGLVVFRDPRARAVFAAMAHHQSPPNGFAEPCAAECMRAMASPAGRGFMAKMQTAFNKDVQGEMIALLIPDVMIIFGEKAKAAEARRTAP